MMAYVPLTGTLRDLYNKYHVVDSNTVPTSCVTKATIDATPPEVLMLSDLILAVLTIEQDDYDTYATFKLFESLPQVSGCGLYLIISSCMCLELVCACFNTLYVHNWSTMVDL